MSKAVLSNCMDLKEQESAQYYGILYICNILEACKLIRWIIVICPRSWYVIVFKNQNTNKAQTGIKEGYI